MRPYIFRLPEWLGELPTWLGGAQVGGRPIFAYGVMLALSFVLGVTLAYYLFYRMGADRKRANLLLILSSLGAIVGARALYFMASSPEPMTIRNFFQFQEGGLVAYGGFLGGIVASLVAEVWVRADWRTLADGVAPVLALGTGVTRFGCFLFGCDFGKRWDGWLAVRFPHWDNPSVAAWIPGGSPAFKQHFRLPSERLAEIASDPVIPTQLMMSLNGFVCFALLMLWLPYRRFRGQMMLFFLGYYAITRFLVEFLRGDKIRGTSTLGLPLSTSQVVSVGLFLVVVPLWFWFSRRQIRD